MSGWPSYDARLLLDTLPANPQSRRFDKSPDLGDDWEDLPPDSEDLFFFSLAEAEDIRREKRRRLVESNHEARLLAMKASDPVEPEANTWEGSDEEVRVIYYRPRCPKFTRKNAARSIRNGLNEQDRCLHRLFPQPGPVGNAHPC
jgi:hypothetical protein